MRSNRHVPIITGLVSLAAAAFFLFYFVGWWRYIPSTLLLAYGWVSLKTGFSASDREIQELTGQRPMSEETSRKLKNWL